MKHGHEEGEGTDTMEGRVQEGEALRDVWFGVRAHAPARCGSVYESSREGAGSRAVQASAHSVCDVSFRGRPGEDDAVLSSCDVAQVCAAVRGGGEQVGEVEAEITLTSRQCGACGQGCSLSRSVAFKNRGRAYPEPGIGSEFDGLIMTESQSFGSQRVGWGDPSSGRYVGKTWKLPETGVFSCS